MGKSSFRNCSHFQIHKSNPTVGIAYFSLLQMIFIFRGLLHKKKKENNSTSLGLHEFLSIECFHCFFFNAEVRLPHYICFLLKKSFPLCVSAVFPVVSPNTFLIVMLIFSNWCSIRGLIFHMVYANEPLSLFSHFECSCTLQRQNHYQMIFYYEFKLFLIREQNIPSETTNLRLFLCNKRSREWIKRSRKY